MPSVSCTGGVVFLGIVVRRRSRIEPFRAGIRGSEVRERQVALFHWHRMGVHTQSQFGVGVTELIRNPADGSPGRYREGRERVRRIVKP